jgi:hypothetical protein
LRIDWAKLTLAAHYDPVRTEGYHRSSRHCIGGYDDLYIAKFLMEIRHNGFRGVDDATGRMQKKSKAFAPVHGIHDRHQTVDFLAGELEFHG